MAILVDVSVQEYDGLLAVGWDILDEITVKKESGPITYYRTKKNGSVLVKKGPRRCKVWVEPEAPRVEEGAVYRLLNGRDEENLQRGMIEPKNYFGQCTPEGHVLYGCRPVFKGSRYISASRSMNGIHAYVRGLLRREGLESFCLESFLESTVIAVIDVSCLWRDHGIQCMDAILLMKGNTSSRFANLAEEVLIDGEIPDDCLTDLLLLKIA